MGYAKEEAVVTVSRGREEDKRRLTEDSQPDSGDEGRLGVDDGGVDGAAGVLVSVISRLCPQHQEAPHADHLHVLGLLDHLVVVACGRGRGRG